MAEADGQSVRSCTLCTNRIVDVKNYRNLKHETCRPYSVIFEELGVPFSGLLCKFCSKKLKRLVKIDFELNTKMDILRNKRETLYSELSQMEGVKLKRQNICTPVPRKTPTPCKSKLLKSSFTPSSPCKTLRWIMPRPEEESKKNTIYINSKEGLEVNDKDERMEKEFDATTLQSRTSPAFMSTTTDVMEIKNEPPVTNIQTSVFSASKQMLHSNSRTRSLFCPPCGVCGKVFNHFIALFRHVSKHSRVYNRENCDICNKLFSSKSDLTRHKRTHTGEKPFKCHVCDKAFTTKCNVKKHIRTHTGDKPYNCEFCDKSFSFNNSLKRHIRTHSGERPFQCHVCNKSFTVNNNLSIHMRTHTGERPYKCDVCGKSFNTKSDLTKHIRTHTGEKPYMCDACNKSFTTNSGFIRHNRTHIEDIYI